MGSVEDTPLRVLSLIRFCSILYTPWQVGADEDQPLEAYMQRLKENMVEKLQVLHSEEMSRAAQVRAAVIGGGKNGQ